LNFVNELRFEEGDKIAIASSISAFIRILQTNPPVALGTSITFTKFKSASAKPIDENQWRLNTAEKAVQLIEKERYSIQAIYLTGDCLQGTADAQSKIELVFVVSLMNDSTNELNIWLDGFSANVADNYFERTGNRIDSLIESKIILESDYAAKNIDSDKKNYKVLWNRMYK
jgi:hypothetical protein